MITKVFPVDMTRAARAVVSDGDNCYCLVLLLSGGGTEVMFESDDKLELLKLAMTVNAGLRGEVYKGFVGNINAEVKREVGVWKAIVNLFRRLL